MTQLGIFYRISFNFVQVFFGSYEMRNSKKNWVSPTQIFWFSIISNHGIFMFFHRKCMENGQKRLFLALKRCFLQKFSTDFFLSLICVIYLSKDLKSVKKTGGHHPQFWNITAFDEKLLQIRAKMATYLHYSVFTLFGLH